MVEISVESRDVLRIPTPMLAVGVFEGQDLVGPAARIDEALGGVVRRLKESGEVTGKRNTVTVLHTSALTGGSGSPLAADRIALVGCGKPEEFDLEGVRSATAAAANKARELRLRSFALAPFPDPNSELETRNSKLREVGQATAEGLRLALYRYDRFKTAEDDRPPEVERAVVLSDDDAQAAALRAGVADGDRLAEAIITARDLATGPANVVTATHLAEQSMALAQTYGFKAQVFGKPELQEMGCGGILAVNQGSAEPPAMGVLRYDCGRAGAKTLAVVGKGITFDTGGISIKPANDMHYMRHDKSGACAVIGFMQAAASLQLPVNVLGIFAATDNMPSGSAYRPGDIIRSYSGKYMEILNTDAEGRVVLADALAYAAEQGPDAIVDLATLTGACVVALGHVCSGLFSNNDLLADALIAAGEGSGERLWRMPLWKEYHEQIKAPLGDIKNIGGSPAGSITAAWFLADFVGEAPWAHLDIAGTAWAQGSWAVMPPYIQRDLATGVGVRLLSYFARAWGNSGAGPERRGTGATSR